MEKGFQIRVRIPLVVPEPTHTKDLLRVDYCHLDVVESLGG